MNPRQCRSQLSFVRLVLLIAGMAPPLAAQEISRRFDLPCLAPLLERADAAAPLSLDEAFLFGPWHAPVERDGIGEISLVIATKSEAAQRWFNQGIALLHLFCYSEAERCFRQALVADPDCPMLYWALSMANERQPQRAALFADEAVRRAVNRAELGGVERGLLKVVGEFYAGQRAVSADRVPPLSGEDQALRRRERIRHLEALAFENPDEVEIEALLLRQVILDQAQHGDPIASYHAIDLLAGKIAASAPAHPSRHYRLLLWLQRDPQRALQFVPGAIRAAPGVANAWRFAGELHRAAGNMAAAAEFFAAAVRLGNRDVDVMPDSVEGLVSNYAALAEALTSMGRYEEAREIARSLITLPRSFYLGKHQSHEQRLAGSYATGRRLLGELQMRCERWENLLSACENGGYLGAGGEGDWFSSADSLFWRGVACANLGKLPEARAALGDLQDVIRKSGGLAADRAARRWIVGRDRGLRTQVEFSAGERRSLPGDEIDTAGLTSDHLARLYFAAGLKAEAIGLIGEELARRPGQPLTIATYADLNFRNGDTKDAFYVFDEGFRTNASLASHDLPAFQRLAPIAGAMRLPVDWRMPAPELPPLPGLPSTESLGPLAWAPPESAAWILPDHHGRATSLAEFRGRPVIVNFFLGVACPFCRVQLDKFAPQLAAYREAGIGFIAITRDPLETLQTITGSGIEKTPAGEKLLPYPVFADPAMLAFRAARAFDDFDQFPMHATILIDTQGRVRWCDRGHSPFNHPEALLGEAKRLTLLQP